MQVLIQSAFNGLSVGSVLLIAALGLAVIFGLMGVINLAHGEFIMLGAYTTHVVQNAFRAALGEASPLFELYLLAALPVAFAVNALVGLALEQGIVRHLYGRPLDTLLATWGVSLILRQFVRSASWALVAGMVLFGLLFGGAIAVLRYRRQWPALRGRATAVLLPLALGIAAAAGMALAQTGPAAIGEPWFGSTNVSVTVPSWLRGGLPVGEMQFPYTRLFILALTAACVAATYWFLRRSRWGMRIRAVTQNRRMSACLGIPTRTVDALTFALGSGLAGLAGVAVSLLGSVGPNVGQNYIIDTFMVVVVGGVGSLVGSIAAALGIGTLTYTIGSGVLPLLLEGIELLQPLAEGLRFFATNSMAKVLVFALIVVFLQFRPQGIFPQRSRA